MKNKDERKYAVHPENTNGNRKYGRTAALIAAAVLTLSAPLWITSSAILPYSQRISVLSGYMQLPTGHNAVTIFSVSGGDVVYPYADTQGVSSTDAVRQESAVTTAVPQETTAAAVTTSADPPAQNVPSGMKPVTETRIGNDGTQAEGIYIKNGTDYKLNVTEAMNTPADCKILLDAGYQVLIIHTHTTESYAESDKEWYDPNYSPRTADKSRNVIALGEVIAEKLKAKGINTLHVTTVHDYPQYNGSYNRAEETIKEYLEKYPSIEMVIDVHRDAITHNDGTKVKPTCTINGKKAAQVMIITGCDNRGKYDFPEWKKNFRMACQLQKQLGQKYEGLMRPLYFVPFRYNMHLTPNSLLIEFGTDVNTLDEALYSAQMVGDGLSELLLKYKVG